MDDRQLPEAPARAQENIHDIGNSYMFREQCRAMAKRIAELESALRPFAKDAEMWVGVADDHRPMFHQAAADPDHAEFTVGDLRRAAAALGERDGTS